MSKRLKPGEPSRYLRPHLPDLPCALFLPWPSIFPANFSKDSGHCVFLPSRTRLRRGAANEPVRFPPCLSRSPHRKISTLHTAGLLGEQGEAEICQNWNGSSHGTGAAIVALVIGVKPNGTLRSGGEWFSGHIA